MRWNKWKWLQQPTSAHGCVVTGLNEKENCAKRLENKQQKLHFAANLVVSFYQRIMWPQKIVKSWMENDTCSDRCRINIHLLVNDKRRQLTAYSFPVLSNSRANECFFPQLKSNSISKYNETQFKISFTGDNKKKTLLIINVISEILRGNLS